MTYKEHFIFSPKTETELKIECIVKIHCKNDMNQSWWTPFINMTRKMYNMPPATKLFRPVQIFNTALVNQ